MTMRAVLSCLAFVAAASVGLAAHHPFATAYNEGREVTITGQIVQLLLRDPHSFVQVRVLGQNHQPQVWSVEWLGQTLLASNQIAFNTLKPGDTIVVTGSPGRNESEHRIRAKVLSRPRDQWEWQAPAAGMAPVKR